MNTKEIRKAQHEAGLEIARLQVWFREIDKMGYQTKNLTENLSIYNQNSTKFRKLNEEMDRLINLEFLVAAN